VVVIGRPQRVVLKSDPDCDAEDDAMEFRLTYEGILLGASKNNTRAKRKHEIRKVFHKQLQRLMWMHPAFEQYHADKLTHLPEDDPARAERKRQFERVISNYERCGYHFFPLATRELSLLCSVKILFLRSDMPGGAIRSGDIDNRMKTIFDALRMPSNKDELGGYDTPGEGEEPFFCLLQDDSLISHAEIETDTLWQPTGDKWDANDARLVVTIRLSPFRVTFANLSFG
jgi:hypothetical protein